MSPGEEGKLWKQIWSQTVILVQSNGVTVGNLLLLLSGPLFSQLQSEGENMDMRAPDAMPEI